MRNTEVADLFDELADLLEIQDVQWKPRAYRTAALNIRSFSTAIELVYKDKGVKGLREIPGIGEHIANKIGEYITSGKIASLEKARKEVPHIVEQMMRMQNIGPKTAKKLYDQLRPKDMNELKKFIKGGKLKGMSGFGEKKEKEILASIRKQEVHGKRHIIADCLPLAEEIASIIAQEKGVTQVMIAGSLARRKETIGDIDIL